MTLDTYGALSPRARAAVSYAAQMRAGLCANARTPITPEILSHFRVEDVTDRQARQEIEGW